MSAFTKTLCAGAAAAASLPLVVQALAPAWGAANALGLHAVVWTAAYLALLARGTRERVGVAVAAAGLGAVAWLAAGSVGSLVVALGVLTAAVRSGFLYRRGSVRSLVLEAGLLAAACAVAAFLYRPGVVGAALATWGWFVVQSFYFLIGGLARRARDPRGDAFEDASRRLEALLDAPG